MREPGERDGEAGGEEGRADGDAEAVEQAFRVDWVLEHAEEVLRRELAVHEAAAADDVEERPEHERPEDGEQQEEEETDKIQNLPGVETVTGNDDQNNENEVKVEKKTPELILKYRKSLMTYVRVAGLLRIEEEENQGAAG